MKINGYSFSAGTTGAAGDLAAALKKLRGCPEDASVCRASSVCPRRSGSESDSPRGCELAETCFRLAGEVRESGRLPEAEALYRECLAICRDLELERGRFIACRELAGLLWSLERRGEALPFYLEAISIGFEVKDYSAVELYEFLKSHYGLAAEEPLTITAEDLAAAAETLGLEGKVLVNEDGVSETYYSPEEQALMVEACLDAWYASAKAPLRYVSEEELAREWGADVEDVKKAVDFLGLRGRRLTGETGAASEGGHR